MKRQHFSHVLMLGLLLLPTSSAFARHGADDRQPDDRGGKRPVASNDDRSFGRQSSRNSSRKEKLRLRTRLEAFSTVDTDAYGSLKVQSKTEGKKSEKSFSGKIEFPVPSIVPALPDATSANSLDFRLELVRVGVQYAECYFGFDGLEIEADDDSSPGTTKVEYKVEISQKTSQGRSRLRFKRGSCDIDLATDGVQRGFPTVQSGDVANVIWVNGTTRQPLLSGDL